MSIVSLSSYATNNPELIFSQGASRLLAPYASIPENTIGRKHNENEAEVRSPYQRDRDRIIHSTAFRRLEYKTQVFVYNEGDHYRTRLTHSLEVAQLSRSIARELKLDEDLAEAIALAHDLGHTPFGHAGEDAMSEAMANYGGFDHNAQTLRILTKLESKYADFDGLNLTWECLEGIAKHNGPVTGELPRALKECNDEFDLGLNSYANLEAQISALCDDIAYNNHDIEDGLRAGLFTIEDISELSFVGEIVGYVKDIYPDLEGDRLIHEMKRRMIDYMVIDLVDQTRVNIEDYNIRSVNDVRNCSSYTANFSTRMQGEISEVKSFLHNNMYNHYKVNRMTTKVKRVVLELFQYFFEHSDCLPTGWSNLAKECSEDEIGRAAVVADFIAGMTDRFALEEHQKIFDNSYKLIGD